MSIRLPLRVAQLAVVLGLAGIAYGARAQVPAQPAARFGPGTRVLLDAHNAYPERGQWSTRIDEALATGLPLAIEQDLVALQLFVVNYFGVHAVNLFLCPIKRI